jgi:hypothetical protein
MFLLVGGELISPPLKYHHDNLHAGLNFLHRSSNVSHAAVLSPTSHL